MCYVRDFLYIINPFFFWFFAGINLVYFVLIIFATFKILIRAKEVVVEDYTTILRSNSLPEISFIIPAYDEEENIVSTIKNILAISYRYKKLIIVNDGSTDNSVEILKKAFDFTPVLKLYEEKLPTQKIKAVYRSKSYPELIFIDKENGRKFDALNAGINACETELFISLDADTFIDDKAFALLIRPILTNPETIAIGASVRIANGCSLVLNTISTFEFPQKMLPAMQTLEYLRAFLERQGWDYIGGNFVLSGAFAIFKTEILRQVGGYADTVAEDMEIIIRLHRMMKRRKESYQIKYLPDPVAWTDCPEKVKVLAHQRKRWHRGLLDCLWFHKRTFFNPVYGIFGFFVYPFWVYSECIEPFVEILGYLCITVGYFLGIVSIKFAMLFLLITWGFTVLFTVSCVLIEEMSFRKYPSLRSLLIFVTFAFVENLWYRQLTLYWRIVGSIMFLKEIVQAQKKSKDVELTLTRAQQKGSS